jgi:hypothetical protein
VLALGDRVRNIDAFLDADPTGRWLLLVENGHTVLLDARQAQTLDLDARGADTRQDRADPHVRRPVAFDPLRPRVAWIERTQNKNALVQRDLETGAEMRLDAGNGEVWRIDFVPGTDAFVVEMIPGDSTGNGRIDWPAPHATSVTDECLRRAPITRQAVWLGRGDTVVTRIVAPNAALREIQGFVGLMNDGVVQREPTGRLVLVRGSERTPFADAKCNAWIYDASAAYGVLLGGCTGTNPAARTHLVLWSLAGKRDLDLEVNPVGPTRPWLVGQRLVPVYPGRDAAVIDVEHRSVVNLKTGDSVLATWKNRILVLREGSLVIHDAAGAPEILLAGTVAPGFDLLRSGPTVVATPLVIDLETAVLRGSVSGRPLAVTSDGRVLVATGGDPSASALAVGPLVWESPVLDAKRDQGR